MSSSSSRMIMLRSNDGQHYLMEEAVAKLSLKLKRIIEANNHVYFNHVNYLIPIDNVKGLILAKVVDYCRKHVISMDDAEALNLFDQEFVRGLDEASMMFLKNAAEYMEIQSLFELCNRTIMSSSSSRIILLRSCDGQDYPIEEAAAKLSLKLKRTIEINDRVNLIYIYDVKGLILAKVVDYCRKHVISKDCAEALKLFDQEFVGNVDEVSMMFLTIAAKNLEIGSLCNLCHQALFHKLQAIPLHEIVVSSRIIVSRRTDGQDFMIKDHVVQLPSTIKQIIEQDTAPNLSFQSLNLMDDTLSHQ